MRKRIVAWTLYLAYGLLLTYLLSFGPPVGRAIANSFRAMLNEYMHEVEIEDVEISLSTEDVYLVGKTYSPKYTAVGQIKVDAGLVFTALDDTVVVGSSGSFRGVRTDDLQTSGRMRITSKYDPDFEKIVTLHFEKKYPSEFSLNWFTKSVGYNTKQAYVGVPMYFYSSVPSSVKYSEKDYVLEYDPTYFELVSTNCLVPILETPKGETVTVRYRYGNGEYRAADELRIYSTPDTESFDEVRFGKESADGMSLLVNKSQLLYLYKDGERVYSDYTVEADASAGLKISTGVPALSFSKPGAHAVTVRLPNGFRQTITVHTYNKMAYPTFQGLDPGTPIELLALEKYSFAYSFPSGMTYKKLTFEYDKSMLTVQSGGQALFLTGKSAGQTTLKIILDDGVQRFEEVYQIVITDEHSFATMLWKNYSKVVYEGMGHMGGFFVLAFFSLNLFRVLAVRRRLLRWGGYVFSGLFFALLTEMIQFFMPQRDCSLSDVGVDMTGFFLGTLLALGCTFVFVKLAKCLAKKRTRAKAASVEAEDDEHTGAVSS